MIVYNPNTLIGDFIGTIPAMQSLQDSEFAIHDCMLELFEMAGLRRSFGTPDISFDLHGAFALADKEGLHMTQANYHFVGLPIPKEPQRASLEVLPMPVDKFDYIIAPFSRSLPEDQLWPYWQQLVYRMPDKSFAVLGANSDNSGYISGKNVTPVFGQSFNYVSNLLLNSQLISVVTGISHLAHALGVKNYLFCAQYGKWGVNPDAVKMRVDAYVDEVIQTLYAKN